jgi:hypothetical protein
MSIGNKILALVEADFNAALIDKDIDEWKAETAEKITAWVREKVLWQIRDAADEWHKLAETYEKDECYDRASTALRYAECNIRKILQRHGIEEGSK